MKCVRCEEGTLVKIRFKESGKSADLCDFCGAMWLEGMTIALGTGFMLNSYQSGIEREFILDEAEDKDQEHRSARYTQFK